MKLKIFIGYDSREDIAYEVARASILEHMDAEVLALRIGRLLQLPMTLQAALTSRPTQAAMATVATSGVQAKACSTQRAL